LTLPSIDLNRSHRAPGVCGVQSELLKSGGSSCASWLNSIIYKVLENGQAPCDWKRGITLPLYKGKGSSNYRGITILSVTGK